MSMLRLIVCSISAALWVLMFSLPSNPQQTSAASDSSRTSASGKFAELSDQFMKDSLALSPSSASAAGYHTHVDPATGKPIELDAMLDDMSLESIAKQRAFYEHWRERFRSETPLSALDPQDAA